MKYRHSIFLLFLFNIGFLFSQEQNTTKVYDEKVIVISGYEPTLKDAVKINVNPSLIDTGIIKYPVEYNVSSKKLTTQYIPEKIKPARIVGEPITLLYRNYLKLGFGSHLMPYAEFYHNNTRSKNVNYGVYLSHLSSWWKIKDYGNSTFSDTEIRIFGKRILKNSILSGDLFYSNNYYHYYGFQKDILPQYNWEDISGKKYSQRLNKVGFGINYASAYDDYRKLNHSIDFKFSNLNGKYGLNELNTKLKANLNKNFTLFDDDSQFFGLNFKWDYYNDKKGMGEALLPLGYVYFRGFPKTKSNASLFDINPYVLLHLRGFDLNLGLHAAFGIADTNKPVLIYPEITVSHSMLNQLMSLKLGISGSFERASFNSLLAENPFISPFSELEFVKNPLNLFGRMEFSLEKHLDLNVELSYSMFKNAPLFGIDSSFVLQNVYVPIYEDYNRLKAGAELIYGEEDYYEIGTSFYYYSYATDFEEEAWYKPNYELRLFGKYMIQDKFIFGLNACFLGKMKNYTWTVDETTGVHTKTIGKLQNRFDISLSAEYRYSKRLSFFLLLNNLANQQYFYWTSYPTHRMNGMLGLTFSF